MSHLGDALGLHGLKKMVGTYEGAVGLKGIPGFVKAGTALAEGAAAIGGGELVGGALGMGGAGGVSSIMPNLGMSGVGQGVAGVLQGVGSGGTAAATEAGDMTLGGGVPDNWLAGLGTNAGSAGGFGGALGKVGSILSGLSGVGQVVSGLQGNKYARQTQGYADQLQALMRDPSIVTKLPGYEAGLEAVRRSLAAQGYQGSGNMMAALAQYGQNAYMQQAQLLARLSSGAPEAQQSSTQDIIGGLGQIGMTFKNWGM